MTQKAVSSRAVGVLITALENAGGDVNSSLKPAGLWNDWPKIKAGELTEVSRVAFANLAKEMRRRATPNKHRQSFFFG